MSLICSRFDSMSHICSTCIPYISMSHLSSTFISPISMSHICSMFISMSHLHSTSISYISMSHLYSKSPPLCLSKCQISPEFSSQSFSTVCLCYAQPVEHIIKPIITHSFTMETSRGNHCVEKLIVDLRCCSHKLDQSQRFPISTQQEIQSLNSLNY